MSNWKKHVARVLLIGHFLLVPLFAIAQAATNAAVPATAKRTPIGMHIHRAIQAPWPTFDFAGWRLLDAGVSWRGIQPNRGQFDFNRLDIWARMGEVKGVELTYVFYGTPAWASARPTEPGANGPGSAAEPKDIEDWRSYVRTVATRYQGRIAYYEVWNEPNWKNFYTGSWEQLAELVREAALIIREVDPKAKIILPGLASEHGLSVIDEFLKTGVGRHVDIIGYHFYTGHRPPEVLFNMVRKLKQSLVQAGLTGKPVWNTEFGWLVEGVDRKINAGTAGFSEKDPVYSDVVAAAFVIRAYAILSSMGIERSYFYAWDNESMGTYDQRAQKIKPAMNAAFLALTRWLTSPVGDCVRQQDRYICMLRGATGDRALIWSVGEPLERNQLAKEWLHAEDMFGVTTTLTASTSPASLGMGPYMLKR